MPIKHQRILNWVNRMRKEHFGKGPLKKLPKGKRSCPGSCPIHNSFWKPYTGGESGRFFLTWRGRDFTVVYPELIKQFIIDFDNGKYPDLEC